MKRWFAFLLSLIIMITAAASAEEISDILPSAGIWGISLEQMTALSSEDYEACSVGDAKGLVQRDFLIDYYIFDAYYVFSGDYDGLSKIAYILTDFEALDKSEIKECCNEMVDIMKEAAGAPSSETKSVTTWNMDGYDIQIGAGRFKNYIGSDDLTVGIVFKSSTPSRTQAAPAEKQAEPSITPTPAPVPVENQPSNDESSQFTGAMVTVTIAGKQVQIHQSFKELMDSYEDFFTSYIDGMSSGNYLQMLGGMEDYIKTMDALEELDDADMTESEAAYYLEVYTRIMQKVALINY